MLSRFFGLRRGASAGRIPLPDFPVWVSRIGAGTPLFRQPVGVRPLPQQASGRRRRRQLSGEGKLFEANTFIVPGYQGALGYGFTTAMG